MENDHLADALLWLRGVLDTHAENGRFEPYDVERAIQEIKAQQISEARRSPLAASVPVAVKLAEGCCSAINPCSHQRIDPTTICDICAKAALSSLPAGAVGVDSPAARALRAYAEASKGQTEAEAQAKLNVRLNPREVLAEFQAATPTRASPDSSAAAGADDIEQWLRDLSTTDLIKALRVEGTLLINEVADRLSILASPVPSTALVEALVAVVSAYKRNNPMRTADMHNSECQCMRCAIDRADAALAAHGRGTGV